jgi:DinB family protein
MTLTNAETEARNRALAYFASKATLRPSEVHEQIAAAFASLDAVLADVPADRAAVRALAGEWSAQEVVDHLLETFRPGVDELRCLLADVRPPGEPIPAALQSKAPRLRPWSWLRDELRGTQADVIDLLARVPADFESKAAAPIVMVVNIPGAPPLHWVQDVDWKAYAIVSWRLHTIDHMKQIRKGLAAR